MTSMLHAPWSDTITLIRRETEKDSSGFETVTEIRSVPPLFCDFEDGVSQSEFYRSRKAGNQAAAQAEVQTVDYLDFFEGYTDMRFAEFRGRRYRILRSFPQTFDSMTLILEEVVR